MEKSFLRLHFRTGAGKFAEGSNTKHRAEIVKRIKERFDVPNEVQLYLVQFHWLNVNMEHHIIPEVLEFLNSLDLFENFGVFNVYPMNGEAKENSDIKNFMVQNNFVGSN